MKSLLILLISLCFSELIHNMIEIWGMRQKVSWLALSLKGEQHGKWFVNIDSKIKTLLLHTFILLFSGGIAYAALLWWNFTNESLVVIGIIMFLLNYIFTTIYVDRFHTAIGKLISGAKKSKKG